MVLALIALIALQFIRLDKNASGYQSVAYFEAETIPSASVTSILRENCYDCHSNQTQYPWYSNIAPLSIWLNEHIVNGKKHFNVSDWENYTVKKKEHKLEELVEMVENGKMPLKSYTLLHGNLTNSETDLLLQWAGLVRMQYKHQLEVSIK